MDWDRTRIAPRLLFHFTYIMDNDDYLWLELSLDEIAASLASPLLYVRDEVALVGSFSHKFGGVVSFVDGAFADGAGQHEVVVFYFFAQTGLAVCGWLWWLNEVLAWFFISLVSTTVWLVRRAWSYRSWVGCNNMYGKMTNYNMKVMCYRHN